MSEWNRYRTVAAEAVEAASKRLVRLLHTGEYRRSTKRTGEWVTSLDRVSDESLCEYLESHYPTIPYLSEERRDAPPREGPFWVADPLDGTANAVFGIPYFATSLALVVNSEPVIGVTKDLNSGDVYWAERGGGFWCNGTRIPKSFVTLPANQAIIATGFTQDRAARAAQLAAIGNVIYDIGDIRRLAAPTLDVCLLAAGRLHGMFEYLHPWDYAAGLVFLAEQEIQHNITRHLDIDDFRSPRFFIAGLRGIYDLLRMRISSTP